MEGRSRAQCSWALSGVGGSRPPQGPGWKPRLPAPIPEPGLGRSGLGHWSQFPGSLRHTGTTGEGSWSKAQQPHPHLRTLVLSASSVDPQTKSAATSVLEEDISSPITATNPSFKHNTQSK